jgi:hypothetical protein
MISANVQRAMSLRISLCKFLRVLFIRIKAHAGFGSPGWTFTGLTARNGGVKPAGAWTAEETVLFMLDHVRAGEFYILCPDNEARRELDQLRIMWAAGDVAEGRPALSRWHRDWKSLFEEYIRESLANME